jgi:hypothetical protein
MIQPRIFRNDKHSWQVQTVPSDQQRAWDGVQHIGRTQKEYIGQIHRHLTDEVTHGDTGRANTTGQISHRLTALRLYSHLVTCFPGH